MGGDGRRGASVTLERVDMAATPPYVITVSGSDSSGAAGVQADNRAIHATGAFPLNVVTALTLQAGQGVQSVEITPPELVRMHLLNLINTYPVEVVKAGMLGSSGNVQVLSDMLNLYPEIRLVLDPVLEASSGRPLLDSEGVAALRDQLIPKAFLVTPNLPELFQLVPTEEGNSGAKEREAARWLIEQGCQALLVKGGHRGGSSSEDRLYVGHGCEVYTASRILSKNTRGTGCSLASLIAGHLACGRSLQESVDLAKNQLSESLSARSKEDWLGAGPAFL